MLEKFKKNALSNEQMKNVKGGSVTCSAWYDLDGYQYNEVGACSGPTPGECVDYCRNQGAYSCSCWVNEQ